MKIKKIIESDLERLRTYTLGQRLKFIRESLQELYGGNLSYSINSVAKAILVISPQGLSAIETDKTNNPTSKTINALAEYYRVPTDIFFDEYYKNNPKPFELGDVEFVHLERPLAKPFLYSCHISVFTETDKISESLKLTSKQINQLMKRIKFEIEQLKEEV
jgi:transcriptional regulator with XRE-family HTH domain